MAFYDYHCEKCDHQFEEMLTLEKMDMPCEAACPACGEVGSVKRVILSSCGVVGTREGSIKMDSRLKNRIDQIRQTYGKRNTNPGKFYNTNISEL